MIYRYYCEEIDLDEVWDEDDFEYNFFQFFLNEYIDLLDDIEVKPSGKCCYDLDFIVTQAKANAFKSYKDLYISISPEAEDSSVMVEAKISLHELICKHLDDEYCNNSYPYLDFAGYKANGKALQMYVEQGVWHYGLLCNDKVITDLEMFPEPKLIGDSYEWLCDSCNCTPVIWFGPSDYSEILPDWSITDDHPCLNVCDGSSCFLDWHRITDDESILIANDDNCEYRDIVLSDGIYSCPVDLRDTCCDGDASVVSGSIVSKYLDRFRNHPYESRYYCSDERMPFDFFANEDPVSYELDLNSLEEELCEFISYVDYPEYRYHPGKHFFVSWEHIENRMVEERTNYIKQVYQGACFYSEQLCNGVIERKERVLTEVLASVTEKRTRPYDAGSDIQQVIEYALQEFLELGQWHDSFRFADGTLCKIVDNSFIEFDGKKWFVDGCSVEPIFWFGQEYDPKDEYWILSRSLSRWKAICKHGELFSADMLDMNSDMMFYRWCEYGLDCSLVEHYIEQVPVSMDYEGNYDPKDIDEFFIGKYLESND